MDNGLDIRPNFVLISYKYSVMFRVSEIPDELVKKYILGGFRIATDHEKELYTGGVVRLKDVGLTVRRQGKSKFKESKVYALIEITDVLLYRDLQELLINGQTYEGIIRDMMQVYKYRKPSQIKTENPINERNNELIETIKKMFSSITEQVNKM